MPVQQVHWSNSYRIAFKLRVASTSWIDWFLTSERETIWVSISLWGRGGEGEKENFRGWDSSLVPVKERSTQLRGKEKFK